MSLNLLNVFTKRELYERFYDFVNTDALNREEKTLFTDIKAWYGGSEATQELDWNAFRGWFFSAQHPKLNVMQSELYNMMFDKLDEYDEPDEAFATNTILSWTLREGMGKIAEMSLAAYEGDRACTIAQLLDVIEEYSDKLGYTSDIEQYMVNDDIEDLVADVTEGGYEWRHEQLNESVGNLRAGKLVLFGARPNAGKTSWLCDNLTHVASQLPDDKVLVWFNNEEAGREVKFRMIQSALKRTAANIKLDPAKAKRDYVSTVGDYNKVLIVDKADLSVKDIQRVLKSLGDSVGCIAFDQLWKVHGFEKIANGPVDRLQVLFQWARETAKRQAVPIICTHQADYTAEGVRELSMAQLHMNKTAIQGECDTIIMMGRSNEAGDEKFRYFNLAKNKGAYGPRVDPKKVEHRYAMELLNEVARYV